MVSHDPQRPIRVRFAPSPTGYLHVGGARTALFNYLFAKQKGGKFILRVEDTDQARSTESSLKMQIEDLIWLGLKWDEGPHPETLNDMGPHAPYRQSQRLSIYAEHAERLLQQGKAYYCFLTDEEIEQQKARSSAHQHLQSPYEDWTLEQAKAKLAQGHKAVVRFKTKNIKKDYVFQDLIRGEVHFPSDMVGDFVLLRSDGMPVYNFCCAVDDALMQISHVLRAEEHLPNTLRQLMIYEAFGWTPPYFGHMSLILGEDRQKLSKRHGATSCHEYKENGYMPESLKNFIALLGWSSPEGKEIVSEAEMISQFAVEKLNPAPAVFDEKKLKWMNSVYLRELSIEKLWQGIAPFLQELELPQDKEWQLRSVEVFRPAIETFKEAQEKYTPLCDKHFSVFEESKETLAWESSRAVLTTWIELLEKLTVDYLSEEQFLSIQDQVKDITGAKGKFLFMPIRVAVIGKPHGAELKILVPLLKKSSLIERAKKVLGSMA